MFKILVFLLFSMPFANNNGSFTAAPTVNCPPVTNVQKTGSGPSHFTFSWTGNEEAGHYGVWWSRQGDSSSGGHSTTSNTAFTFTGLAPGHYTFYVVSDCGSTVSGWVSIEDVINS